MRQEKDQRETQSAEQDEESGYIAKIANLIRQDFRPVAVRNADCR
jgi:hypothetical protein